jgi:hypothetical protein
MRVLENLNLRAAIRQIPEIISDDPEDRANVAKDRWKVTSRNRLIAFGRARQFSKNSSMLS